jgi:hypothetical protein
VGGGGGGGGGGVVHTVTDTTDPPHSTSASPCGRVGLLGHRIILFENQRSCTHVVMHQVHDF